MDLKFERVKRRATFSSDKRLVAYLSDDNWDDFSFKTLYFLTIVDEDGTKHEIGLIKIGYFGQKPNTRTDIPTNFSELDEGFFSLGQDVEYYKNIQKLSERPQKQLLGRLKDIVVNEELQKKALDEEVTKTSLLRSVSLSSIKRQFKWVVGGGVELTEYNFNYIVEKTQNVAGLELVFRILPDSNPPTNIHVLIGRNGVGKTYMLNNMAKALVHRNLLHESVGKFVEMSQSDVGGDGDELFAGVVSVSFSAFDPTPKQEDKTVGLRYFYVGLKSNDYKDKGTQRKRV